MLFNELATNKGVMSNTTTIQTWVLCQWQLLNCSTAWQLSRHTQLNLLIARVMFSIIFYLHHSVTTLKHTFIPQSGEMLEQSSHSELISAAQQSNCSDSMSLWNPLQDCVATQPKRSTVEQTWRSLLWCLLHFAQWSHIVCLVKLCYFSTVALVWCWQFPSGSCVAMFPFCCNSSWRLISLINIFWFQPFRQLLTVPDLCPAACFLAFL